MSDSDKVFAGSIPEIYETYLVPLIFEPYAADVANRLRLRGVWRVLEVAAGTGVVTRALAGALDDAASIVATDLNAAMLRQASAKGTKRPVKWCVADSGNLPFDDSAFDAVVCQFGVMFFPDKVRAYAEARRVLRPGGVLVYSVWDRLAENEFAQVVTDALESEFPADPPRFLARTPHGHHDLAVIERNLRDAGFTSAARAETVAARSRAPSPLAPAIGYCQGTPLRNEIVARDASRLGDATGAAASAIARRFGTGSVVGKIQAHVITVAR